MARPAQQVPLGQATSGATPTGPPAPRGAFHNARPCPKVCHPGNPGSDTARSLSRTLLCHPVSAPDSPPVTAPRAGREAREGFIGSTAPSGTGPEAAPGGGTGRARPRTEPESGAIAPSQPAGCHRTRVILTGTEREQSKEWEQPLGSGPFCPTVPLKSRI